MVDPSVGERLTRLEKALHTAAALVSASTREWENKCEGAFAEFRVSCVHLRREQETLDMLADKESAWRYICKFCKCRPFLHDRCNEVLQILMRSDAWMKAFVDAGMDARDLPQNVRKEFERRLADADPTYVPTTPMDAAPSGGAPAVSKDTASAFARPSNMAVVVQRCTSASIVVDAHSGTSREIGHGLVVHVSFSSKAKQDSVAYAADFLLTAKLCTSEVAHLQDTAQSQSRPGAKQSINAVVTSSKPQSLIALCGQGEKQGILIVPEFSLCSDLQKDSAELSYDHACAPDVAHVLYQAFVRSVAEGANRLAGADQVSIVAGTFEGDQLFSMTTAGRPFMHAFHF